MDIKIKFFFFFLIYAVSVSAQKNLVVYHTTGEIKIIAGNKTTSAERGTVITKKDVLLIKKNSDCMLITADGKSAQVSVAGTYNFDDLQKMIANAGNNNVSSKFFSYVYQNLFSGHKKDDLGITPVVFRGEKLMKMPGDNAIILTNNFIFNWKKSAGSSSVNLVIKDSMQTLLDTVIKKTTSLKINFTGRDLLPGKTYQWKAEEAGIHQKEDYYFKFLIAEKKDRKNILKDLEIMKNKNLSSEMKEQLQQDIFIKWKIFYLEKK